MTTRSIAILAGVMVLLSGAPRPTDAAMIEYRFSGLLTGEKQDILDWVSLVDVPFEVSIGAESDAAFELGQITGLGTAYVNTGDATWTVDGFGTATAANTQIFSLPSVARVGFGWNGEVFPLDTTEPAEHAFTFSGSPFALDPSYGTLDAVVPSIPLGLLTELENPPGTLPAYTTSIAFPDEGPLTLHELTSVSYEVVAIPEPSTGVLLLMGLAGLSTHRERSRVRGGERSRARGRRCSSGRTAD